MHDSNDLIQSLRDLGLTRTEAQVYLAVLREGAKGPVSGYRVAQSMGRDPANLGKTLAALVTRGAVQVVQDKPRLFQPRTPDEFMDNIVSSVRVTSESVRVQLRDLAPVSVGGHPLTLQDQDRVLEKTRRLLLACSSDLHLAASPEVMDALCDQINRLSAPGTVRLHLQSAAPCPDLKPDLLIAPVPPGFSEVLPHPWLQMVVDRRAILMAVFKPDCSLENPCGWWLEDNGFGAVMAATLVGAPAGTPDVPWEPAPDAAPEPEPLVETSLPEQDAATPVFEDLPPEQEAPAPAFESEADILASESGAPAPEPGPEPEAQPAPDPEPATGPPKDTGFQFIVRHEDEEESPDGAKLKGSS